MAFVTEQQLRDKYASRAVSCLKSTITKMKGHYEAEASQEDLVILVIDLELEKAEEERKLAAEKAAKLIADREAEERKLAANREAEERKLIADREAEERKLAAEERKLAADREAEERKI